MPRERTSEDVTRAMSCGHCLQRNVRQADIVELETDRIVEAIRQAWFAALPLVGINLTGGETFATPEILVGHLREIGLGMLALSYDERVHQNPRTLNALLGAMRACEQNQLPDQIIFTGITTDEMGRILQLAAQSVPFPLEHAIPVLMPKIDLGGAAGSLPGLPLGMAMACSIWRQFIFVWVGSITC
jgi:hypothetical protein